MITTKEIPAQPVLIVRSTIPRAEIAATVQSSLEAVSKYALGKNVTFIGAPFARYLKVGDIITMEVGLPISAPHPTEANDGNVAYSELAGGLVATTTHQGPYDQLPAAWQEMRAWLASSGHKPSGEFPWESYINDPGHVPDPKDWKTELFWPLES